MKYILIIEFIKRTYVIHFTRIKQMEKSLLLELSAHVNKHRDRNGIRSKRNIMFKSNSTRNEVI